MKKQMLIEKRYPNLTDFNKKLTDFIQFDNNFLAGKFVDIVAVLEKTIASWQQIRTKHSGAVESVMTYIVVIILALETMMTVAVPRKSMHGLHQD